MKFINLATLALEMLFAPRGSEIGSMVDILGVGVIIRGESGIGKSESVLALIERGYSLVSDDITRVTLVDGREIIGTSAEVTRNHMEVRGIGIINVASMFGVRSIRTQKQVDLVVTLKAWDDVPDVDRLGMEQEYVKILGVDVPHIIIPVRPGRDLARLIEVAAFQIKLKSSGQNPAKELNDRLIAQMAGNIQMIIQWNNFPWQTSNNQHAMSSAKKPGGKHAMQREFVVINKLGIHARPAALFVKTANRFYLQHHGRKGRRGSQRQEHHGPDDAGRRPRQQIAGQLRRGGLPRRRWPKSRPSSNANSTKNRPTMPGDFDVKYVAHLARIALTPDEQEKFGAQLSNILGYIEKLNELDVSQHRTDRPRRAAGQCFPPRRSPPFALQRGSLAQRPRQRQRPFPGAEDCRVMRPPC